MATIRHRLTPVLLALATLMAPAVAAAEEADSEIIRTGTYDTDVFASARRVTVQAEVDGGVIVMGGEVDIRSSITGDVVTLGGRVAVGDVVAGDVIATGGHIDVRGQIGGDVTATGGDVGIEATIAGNVLAMGGRARLTGRIDGDLKTAAGDAAITGAVGGNVMLMGGHARLDPSADIKGNAWIFGGRVKVDGRVGRDVRAAGRHVAIAGEVLGDVHIDGLEVAILPTAHIRGNLTYRSPWEADIHGDARIAGDVTYIQSEEPRQVLGHAFAAAGALIFAIIGGLIVLGAAQVLVLPNLSLAAAGRAKDEPWKALGVGVAVLVATPIAIVLLMSTVIGILLGLVAGAAYLITLALGFSISAILVGRTGLARLGRDWDDKAWGRIGTVVIGLLVISVVALIPLLGAVVALFALALGVGALFLHAWRRDAIPGA